MVFKQFFSFEKTLMEHETPPPFMENSITKFPFCFLITSLLPPLCFPALLFTKVS